MSPSEIAVKLGEDLHSVSYHVRELEKLGFLELVGEKQVRGAVQHFFRAVERPFIATDDWSKLTPEERRPISQYVMQLIVGEAVFADEEGTFDKREDRFLTRMPMYVDEEGWQELYDVHLESMNRILEIQANAAARLAEDNETESFPILAATICIEMPQS